MQNKNYNRRTVFLKAGVLLGIFLLILGCLLILLNVGVLPAGMRKVFFSWAMILVLIGIIQLVYKNYFSGIVFLSVGVFFTLPRLAAAYPDYFAAFPDNFVSLYWPVLMIEAGLLLILYRIFGYKSKKRYWENSQQRSKVKGAVGGFTHNAVFSTATYYATDSEMSEGEVIAVFGSAKVNLRKTTLPVGETFLYVKSVFGNVEILTPDNWYIELRVNSVFGEMKDKRFLREKPDAERKLIIVGDCVFGTGEIY